MASTSQPNSNGNDAGTRLSAYYTGGTGSGVAGCSNHPDEQGLLCQTSYAGNPASGPAMITTGYTYNDLQEPTTVTETSGATSRTHSTTYDDAGRQIGTSLNVTGLTGSAPVPDLSYGYNNATGLPTTTSPAGGANGGTITTGYDHWGRTDSYATSQGSTETTYDAAGETSTVDGADGTVTTYTYDGTDAAGNPERRGLVTSEHVATATTSTTIGAAFDAAGNPEKETYGGGVSLTNIYDTAGDLTDRTYSGGVTDANSGQVNADQPWIGWSQTFDGLGHVTQDWTPDGAAISGNTTGQAATGYARAYTYDPADRLTRVVDQTSTNATPVLDENGMPVEGAASSCVIRSYTFDADGNRTSKTTTPAASEGTCQTGAVPTGATTTKWTYDTADRIANNGYVFDNLGRITTIPQADTPAAQHGGAPSDLTLGYFDNDQVHTQTQNGTTLTNALDAAGWPLAQATGSTDGSSTSTTSYGYNDATDNPAFETTTTGTSITSEAYPIGPDGLLAATVTSAGTVQVAINDLHGDCASQVTLPADGDATGIDDWVRTDEYGNSDTDVAVGLTATNPIGGATGGLGYGWTGAHLRVTEPNGLIQMGARVYDSATGLFTSSDPQFAGNSTAYAYPQDPRDGFDLTGLCWFGGGWCHPIAHAWHIAVHYVKHNVWKWLSGFSFSLGARLTCYGLSYAFAEELDAPGWAKYVCKAVGKGAGYVWKNFIWN
ncbi:MAG: hypothetical protein FWE71_05570 [Nocardioidaceae bacterium]|nr:hypothetical protein [Nocardioidaceae bacterium]MCL2614503.1 hypothetical protein [Nocardioidaceae bacterium]